MDSNNPFAAHEQRNQVVKWLSQNNFCAMPFYHIAVEANGDIRPCCLGDVIKNSDGTNLNVRGRTLEDVINDPAHINYRQHFKENKQHPACHPCWGEFHGDKFAGRYTYSSSFNVVDEVVNVMNGQDPEQKLVWLEIKAGNRCNLACRICGLWNSAKWLKETYEIKKQQNADYPEFKNSPEFEYNQQAKWIDDIEFWQSIDCLEDIKVIHIMGGEPMMIEEHFVMLDLISKKFDAKEITIWYNTNATVIPTVDQEEILSRFKSISWSLSIDDHGEKFNYQRSGAQWDQVVKNIFYFFSQPNYRASIDATISVFNILTINEFVNELDKLKIADIFAPHFVTAGANNIRTLHPTIKNIVTEKLKNEMEKISQHVDYHYNEILKYMNSMDLWSEKYDRERKHNIYQVDGLRAESFINTFPEISKLLGYE